MDENKLAIECETKTVDFTKCQFVTLTCCHCILETFRESKHTKMSVAHHGIFFLDQRFEVGTQSLSQPPSHTYAITSICAKILPCNMTDMICAHCAELFCQHQFTDKPTAGGHTSRCTSRTCTQFLHCKHKRQQHICRRPSCTRTIWVIGLQQCCLTTVTTRYNDIGTRAAL